jgi:hypothetical protein
VCLQERLVIISNTTGLSFAPERIGPLVAIIITIFYLLVLYLSALSNTPKNLFASIYSDSLIKTACQHLLLLVGFDTLIHQKYYDTPPILVGHQLVKRSVVCTPKDQGGLGIRNLQVKNTTLLGKWLFKLLTENGMWQTLLKRKYVGSKALSQVSWK